MEHRIDKKRFYHLERIYQIHHFQILEQIKERLHFTSCVCTFLDKFDSCTVWVDIDVFFSEYSASFPVDIFWLPTNPPGRSYFSSVCCEFRSKCFISWSRVYKRRVTDCTVECTERDTTHQSKVETTSDTLRCLSLPNHWYLKENIVYLEVYIDYTCWY